eukprot:scaffold10478_cov38-Cyclotella_meneghiniana.AAC.5
MSAGEYEKPASPLQEGFHPLPVAAINIVECKKCLCTSTLGIVAKHKCDNIGKIDAADLLSQLHNQDDLSSQCAPAFDFMVIVTPQEQSTTKRAKKKAKSTIKNCPDPNNLLPEFDCCI